MTDQSSRTSPFLDIGSAADFAAMPPVAGWDVPRASAIAWVTSHFAVIAVFVVVVAAEAGADEWWRILVAIAWATVASGVTARLSRYLIRSDDLQLRERVAAPRQSRVYTAELKFSIFVMLTYVTYLAIHSLGAAVAAGFVAVFAFVSALRISGLEAWLGRVRPPLYYVSSVVSMRGLLTLALLIAISGAVLVVSELLIDPLNPDANAFAEALTGSEVSRGAQFRLLASTSALLAVPVAGICEAIAAVHRYESELTDRLSAQQIREERDQIGLQIHNAGSLAKVRTLKATKLTAAQLELIESIEVDLRKLRQTRDRHAAAQKLRFSFDGPAQLATALNLELDLQMTRLTLDSLIGPSAADLAEQTLLNQLNNSSRAGAGVVTIAASIHSAVLEIRYSDDGGGFDPRLALAKHRGLAELQRSLRADGGSLAFDWSGGRTESTATIHLAELRERNK